MDDATAIRQRKLAALQERLAVQQNDALGEEQRVMQSIAMLENFVRPHLARDAWDRYTNIKLAHPEKAVKMLAVLAQVLQEGRLQGELSDAQFKQLASQLEPPQRKTNIKITRKTS